MMLKVTCAIIVKQGKILAVQNGYGSDHPYQWEFPGGKKDNDETNEECIMREIEEELDIEIDVVKRLQSVKWDYGFKKIELIPFLCTIKSGEIKLKEHNQLRWVDFKTLRKLNLSEADLELIKSPQNRQILEEYLRENMYDS